MLSKALLPVCLYVSLLLSTSYAHTHDLSGLQRDHAHLNAKRLIKKRSPQGIDFPDLPDPIGLAGAGSIPSSTSSSSSTSASATATPASSSTVSSLQSSSTPASSSTASSNASSSTSASESSSSSASSSSSSVSSSSSSTTSSSSTAPPAHQSSEILNVIGQPTPSVSVVAGRTVTMTSSVDAAQETSSEPAPLSAVAKSKSNTMTIIIAIAASIGGIAILWTVFRKWKLSSSKAFDQRLNPIDWQPTTEKDDIIPSHRRIPSGSSGRSGSTRRDPLDHDFTAGPSTNSPVGGYADLARGASPIPPAHENLTRGPSFNRGYDHNVPLHHQAGYGDAYNYNGGNARY
ncbi:hypothetical protein CPC08DRAFT_733767 [Agrocybe pediades]|nr:hypothetical protein CPC08DRAFT_733767 [Agrocybe pediades]